MESSQLLDARPQLDVGASAGHVGRDCDGAALSRARNNLGLALVVLCVQHIVDDVLPCEQPGEKFGDLDRDRADQDGLPLLVALGNLLDDGAVLLALRLVDSVVVVDSDAGPVRGDCDHVQLID